MTTLKEKSGTAVAADWPEALLELGSDALARDASIGVLRRVGLVERAGPVVSMHRLVQTVLRERLDEDERKAWAQRALDLLDVALPDPEDHDRWHEFQALVPHVDAAIAHARRDSMVAGRLLNQGIYLSVTARFDEAQAAQERALAILEAAYGPDHPQVASTLRNLERVEQQRGREF